MTTEAQLISDYETRRAADIAAAAAKAAAFRITAGRIAAALGDGWTLQPRRVHDMGGEMSPELIHGTTERITLVNGGYKLQGRIEVYGHWPQLPSGANWYPRNVKTTITVSADKTPAQIARDIERRFVPGYRAQLQHAADAIAAETTRRNGCAATWAQIDAAAPGALRLHTYNRSNDPGAETRSASLNSRAGISGEVQITAGHVYISRLSMTGDQAAIVLAALAAIKGAE